MVIRAVYLHSSLRCIVLDIMKMRQEIDELALKDLVREAVALNLDD